MNVQLSLPVLPVADPAWASAVIAGLDAEKKLRRRDEIDRAVLSELDGDEWWVSTQDISALISLRHGVTGLAFGRIVGPLMCMRTRGLIISHRERERGHYTVHWLATTAGLELLR